MERYIVSVNGINDAHYSHFVGGVLHESPVDEFGRNLFDNHKAANRELDTRLKTTIRVHNHNSTPRWRED